MILRRQNHEKLYLKFVKKNSKIVWQFTNENGCFWYVANENFFTSTMTLFLCLLDLTSQKSYHKRERMSYDQIKMAAHWDGCDHNLLWMYIIFNKRFHDFEDLNHPKEKYFYKDQAFLSKIISSEDLFIFEKRWTSSLLHCDRYKNNLFLNRSFRWPP